MRAIVEGQVEGQAIVSLTPISFLGGVNPKTGVITDPENILYGKSISNKIFVFPEGIGSTVGSYVIYGLKINGVAPLAMVANQAETIVIAGAILANIPFVDHPDVDITKVIVSGDNIKIDTINKIIKIKRD
ncbi:MAG: DUF126 domain-containing protein [Candidatus Heimdallarchaeota archaeon]|nr:DUF126 domain-containing protein [Candidatus Heimdallarchaeota archaeon]MCK4953989.1 DUF126 domain-containing protein [Candidatus Heimdallarchaeota archaeon]